MKFDQSFSQIMKDLKFDFTDELGFFFQLIKQERKQHIIELSKEFGIVTPYTSFVAIEERTEVEYKGSFTGSCLIFWNCKNCTKTVCGNCMEHCKVPVHLIFYILNTDICTFVFANRFMMNILFKNNIHVWSCVYM